VDKINKVPQQVYKRLGELSTSTTFRSFTVLNRQLDIGCPNQLATAWQVSQPLPLTDTTRLAAGPVGMMIDNTCLRCNWHGWSTIYLGAAVSVTII